jgi:hypothetical protein
VTQSGHHQALLVALSAAKGEAAGNVSAVRNRRRRVRTTRPSAESKKLSMRRLLIAALVCGGLVPGSVSAGPSASVRAACLNDAKKFCASVIQDDEARRRCMTEHRAELSDGCKAAVAASTGAGGKADLATCRKLAHDKYYIENGRMLNNAVGYAVARCLKGGPGAL